ncbi:MAG: class I SAM-dependent methyltransferase [Nitrosomonadales bacterium]|nr:class I SAM-dependent methyltransferase [Nitrosomonadales bacterium]
MTEPDDIDIDCDGINMKSIWANARSKNEAIGYGGSVEAVKANLSQTGYPESQMHFIAGDVMQTIPAQVPSKISLLRLDTDWYKSTLHELEHLYDLIVPRGVLVIDDYGWCRGSRQATDEFFQDQPFKPMMHRVAQHVRVIIKPAL